MAQSHLSRNPFWVLGASAQDIRQKLLELADARSLSADADACREARADLMNPRARLTAEIGWLPGIDAVNAARLMNALGSEPMSLRHEPNLPALAHANLLTAVWGTVDADATAQEVAAFIHETAVITNRISAAQVLEAINADRAVSGFPFIPGVGEVQAELSERLQMIQSAIRNALNRLPTSSLIDAMVTAVTPARGAEGALPLVDELIDRHYEVGARAFLEGEATHVKELIEAITTRAVAGEAALDPLLEKLEEVIRNWLKVARPILISARTRGINHPPSAHLAGSVRDLCISLHNDYDMYSSMQRLNTLLLECGVELPDLYARIEADALYLADNEQRFKQFTQRIGMRAEIGTWRKELLAICPSGVRFNDTHYPLKSIRSVRFGGVMQGARSAFGMPRYVLALGDRDHETEFFLSSKPIYDAFVDKLWYAVGSRLVTEMLKSLQAGESFRFGDTIVRDDCIEMPHRRLFGKSSISLCRWNGVQSWNSNGLCYIKGILGKRGVVAFAYSKTPNLAVLWSVMNAARGRPDLQRLSELLVPEPKPA